MLGRSFLIATLTTTIASASIAQKMKKEDYPDYRTNKESFARLSDKSLRADLGVFSIGGVEESLNKIPLRKISPYSYSLNQMTFKDDKIEVQVNTGPFEERGRKIQKMDDYILKIAGKPYHGDYGNMPEREIKSVLVLVNKDTVVIPPAAFGDLYNLNFTYKDKSGTERTANGIFFSKDEKRMYIYLLSRDETGSYEVTWIIENKQYLRRVVDYGFTK